MVYFPWFSIVMLVYWRVRQSFCFSHLPSGTMARKSQVSGLQSPWHLGPGFSRFSPATSSRCSNFYKFHYVPLTQICIVRIYSYISYISILYPLIYKKLTSQTRPVPRPGHFNGVIAQPRQSPKRADRPHLPAILLLGDPDPWCCQPCGVHKKSTPHLGWSPWLMDTLW